MDIARVLQAYSPKANLRSLWSRPSERYAAVDGIRALSMMWIVLGHVCLALSRALTYDEYVKLMDRVPWIFAWALHGEKVLDTFFVVSGFLIGMMLLTEHAKKGSIQLRRFYARRYLRLMPAYAVALVALWFSHTQGAEKDPYVWANLLYVNNFLPQKHMFMDWSWSLAVEEQFYIGMPLFLLFVFFRSKRPVVPLVALGVLALVIRAVVLALHPNITRVDFGEHFIVCAPHYSEEYFDALYVNLYTRFFPFVPGLALAWVAVSHEAWIRRLLGVHPRLGDGVLAVGTLTLVGLIAVPAFNQHVTLSRTALWLFIWGGRSAWSLGLTLAMVALLFPTTPFTRGAAKLLSARIWYPIAQLSYCAYLFHLAFVLPGLLIAAAALQPGVPFTEAVTHLDGGAIVLTYAFTLSCSFIAGTLVYLTVERPFLNLRPR
jgi:peptidoglycan/LPS O-acetylase OafA/YrhL